MGRNDDNVDESDVDDDDTYDDDEELPVGVVRLVRCMVHIGVGTDQNSQG